MDANRFDDWTRLLQTSLARRRLQGSLLAAVALGLTGLADASAKRHRRARHHATTLRHQGRDDINAEKKKKKKKKHSVPPVSPPSPPPPPLSPSPPPPPVACAATCTGGCCTSEFGNCILPAQQGGSQCGASGELCHACVCRPLGGTCAHNNDCCTDPVLVVQCDEQHCCRPPGQLCGATDECCPQLSCAQSDFSSDMRCLGMAGSPCTHPSLCASGLICSTGHCCVNAGFACTQNSDCCAAAAVCQAVPGSGPNARCCLPAGGFCLSNGECCSGTCSLVTGVGQVCV
jgi:hypothetical protein